jgi:hypothetical protein
MGTVKGPQVVFTENLLRIFLFALSLPVMLTGCTSAEQETNLIHVELTADSGPYFVKILFPYGNPFRGGPEEGGGMWVGRNLNPNNTGPLDCSPVDPDFWMQITVRRDVNGDALFNATWHQLDCYHYSAHISSTGQVSLAREYGSDRTPIQPSIVVPNTAAE